MRVLHCLAQLPTRTGSGVYYKNLIRALARTEIRQAALYAVPPGYDTSWLRADEHYPVCFETPDLDFPIAGMSDVMPYASTVYSEMTPAMIADWKRAFTRSLTWAKTSFEPDVVVCHHLWMLASLVLKIFPDTPVLGISHGTDIRQAICHPELAAREVGSLAGLDGVLALSSLQCRDLCTLFDVEPSAIRVTGGAYDRSLFYFDENEPARCSVTEPSGRRLSPNGATARADKAIRFLYAGKLAATKGVFELVEAFHRMRDAVPRAGLDLVGRADDATECELARRSADDEAIFIFDTESQAELACHMRRADIFVLPSYYEGLGLIALEAVASGMALVANRLPALEEQMRRIFPDGVSTDVVRWVDLPPLEGLDRIHPKAVPAYVAELTQALTEQASRVRRPEAIRARREASEALRSVSWDGLGRRIERILRELAGV